MNRYGKLIVSVAVGSLLLACGAVSRANDLNNAEPLPAPNGVVAPRSVVVPNRATPADAVSNGNDLNTAGPIAGDPNCTAPLVMATPCCCTPCIEYRHHGRPICCCDCNTPATIHAVLQVRNPRTCCMMEIPVCLPGCCTDQPCVSGHCGALGRGVMRFRYCCGVRITVVFRACGDIIVTYLHA